MKTRNRGGDEIRAAPCFALFMILLNHQTLALTAGPAKPRGSGAMGFEKTGLSLEGKSAVVIGGTSGIGRALALGLANAGADVAASSRRQEQVDSTAAEIEQTGKRTLRVASDVADRASLETLLAAAVKQFGKVDILINCAGKTKRAPTIDFPEDVWNDIMETNLTGTLRACQIFGKHMMERG